MPRPPRHAPAVVITEVSPSVDGGRHPVKRICGEALVVTADVFKDGHDVVSAALWWRKAGAARWNESPFVAGDNDAWRGEVCFPAPGRYEYTVAAWPDPLATWIRDFGKKVDAGLTSLHLEIQEGKLLLLAAADRASTTRRHEEAGAISALADLLTSLPPAETRTLVQSPEVQNLLSAWPDRALLTVHPVCFPVDVESERARFSAWYEFFPRNALGDGRTHATFNDCDPILDHAARLGFDVIYLPPVHPIGLAHRKGKNNATTALPGEPGSPWAIGGPEGGHDAIHPGLGTLADFRSFVRRARDRGLELAMDFALQCSPDHPWVREHPDWFHTRPDGSIQYAENPPKKYQDIYPLRFHHDGWREMWDALRDVLLFWISQGVHIFRVDNPHTKPVAFWEYIIREVRRLHPDTIFLSEAFTRPKMMSELGKVGFSQSYTYFTWRTTRDELRAYVEELTTTPLKDHMRGNFWPNTPDILAYELWHAPPTKFKIRAALAATLLPSWGIYSGYEFCENEPLPPKEEYLDSEKYQLRARDWQADGITSFIASLNRLRRENPAFHGYDNIRFADTSHGNLIAYVKSTPCRSNRVAVIINLDPANPAEGMVHLPLDFLGIGQNQSYTVHDLLTDETWRWCGASNYVSLAPSVRVAHVFRIET